MRLSSIDASTYTANISPRQRVALGGIFVTLVVVVYWQFFLRSEWAVQSEVQVEFARLRAEVEQTRQIANQKAPLEREIKALEAVLQQTIMKLPAEKEIPSLLKQVADLGWETDLDVAMFKPGSPVMKEFYTEVPVQLKVLGTYHDLGMLFERLGRLDRIVNVADLTIRSAGKGQKAGDSIQAEFGVVTYTYPSTTPRTNSSAARAKSDEAASTAQ